MDNEAGGWVAFAVFFGAAFLLLVGCVIDTIKKEALPYYLGIVVVAMLSGVGIYAVEVFR